MSIDPTNNASNVPSEVRRVANNKPQTRADSTRNAAGAGPTRANNTARVDSSQDIDAARVAEIKRAIGNGALDLQPQRIADGILASARELTGR